MHENIKSKVISKINFSSIFALQLDETTDVSNLSELLVYIRYAADKRINEEFLFCQPLETTSKAANIFQVLIDFFDKTKLSCSKLVGVCTDKCTSHDWCKLWIGFLGKAKKSSNSRNALHDSQSGTRFQNNFEETT